MVIYRLALVPAETQLCVCFGRGDCSSRQCEWKEAGDRISALLRDSLPGSVLPYQCLLAVELLCAPKLPPGHVRQCGERGWVLIIVPALEHKAFVPFQAGNELQLYALQEKGGRVVGSVPGGKWAVAGGWWTACVSKVFLQRCTHAIDQPPCALTFLAIITLVPSKVSIRTLPASASL